MGMDHNPNPVSVVGYTVSASGIREHILPSAPLPARPPQPPAPVQAQAPAPSARQRAREAWGVEPQLITGVPS